MRRTVTLIVIAVLSSIVAACDGDVRDADSPAPALVSGAAAPAGLDDIIITSTGGEVDLGLVRDTVFLSLSDSVLTKVRRELDSSALNVDSGGGGFGARIEKMVKSKVQSALSKRIAYPLAGIEDARYEDGEIKLVLSGKKRLLSFDNVTVGKKKAALESFTPDDAERFVAAVRAAKARESTAGGALSRP